MRLIFFRGLGLISHSVSTFVAAVKVWEDDDNDDDGAIPELHSSCLGSDSVALRKRAILEERGRRSRLHRAEVHGALAPAKN